MHQGSSQLLPGMLKSRFHSVLTCWKVSQNTLIPCPWRPPCTPRPEGPRQVRCQCRLMWYGFARLSFAYLSPFPSPHWLKATKGLEDSKLQAWLCFCNEWWLPVGKVCEWVGLMLGAPTNILPTSSQTGSTHFFFRASTPISVAFCRFRRGALR